jgi:choline dehydrogenase-like flavoprotein
MPFITPAQLATTYDVVVVGSGAAGGQMAYTLTMAGAKVLVLEAGRSFDPVRETAMFQVPSQAPLRAMPTPDKQYGFYDASIESGWTMPGEPYTQAYTSPGRQFRWWRQRMLGGRTNHWGRVTPRYGPYDFKTYSRDGLGFDWPISYEDLAPYYDKVEMLIGVFGTNEGLENSPDSSPGVLLPAPKFRIGERLTHQHARRIGMPVISQHRAVLTVRQDADRLPPVLHPNNPKAQRILADSMRSRAACFFATDCHRGCSIKAAYDSTTVHLTPALATGNLDILPKVMVREVNVNRSGRATGVSFIDKTNNQEGQVSARCVVVAAGTHESVRLLFNSKSALFPQGLANASGLLGKYIMDSVSSNLRGQIPALEGLPAHNDDGVVGPHTYIPWWLYSEQKSGKLDFPRGYKITVSCSRSMPGMGTAIGFDWLEGGNVGYGAKFKADARRYYGSFLGLSTRGQMVPNKDCFCEIDPHARDQWGIPALRFHWKWGDYELRQVAHQQQAMGALIETMGGRINRPPATDPGLVINEAGRAIHEVGGAMMGADPRRSVCDKWNQTWEVKNLILADGAVFTGNASKNPTLTIMALAWRAADHLLEELRQGNI